MSPDDVMKKTLQERGAELERWFRKLTTRQQLYMRSAVCDGKDDLEIANALKAVYDDVREFVVLRKWRDKDQSDAEDQRKQKALLNGWREAVSYKAQEVSLEALHLAGEAVAMKDSKGLANAARGAASLVAIARQAEGMDSKESAAQSGFSINLFYIPSPVKAEVAVPEIAATKVEDAELY